MATGSIGPGVPKQTYPGIARRNQGLSSIDRVRPSANTATRGMVSFRLTSTRRSSGADPSTDSRPRDTLDVCKSVCSRHDVGVETRSRSGTHLASAPGPADISVKAQDPVEQPSRDGHHPCVRQQQPGSTRDQRSRRLRAVIDGLCFARLYPAIADTAGIGTSGNGLVLRKMRLDRHPRLIRHPDQRHPILAFRSLVNRESLHRPADR